ncbi:STAS domain-containing protein [Candidatus Poribacteria bacterium]|nr:STAS domain-containing protein [Candidatus Poribacteria bacterium]
MDEVFKIREVGKVIIVDLIGELDRFSVLSVKNEIRTLLKKGSSKLVVNFQNIDHINSTIIGALVTLQHLARENGGDLKLCGLKDHIRRTFDLIGASKILQIFDKEEEAIASYG